MSKLALLGDGLVTFLDSVPVPLVDLGAAEVEHVSHRLDLGTVPVGVLLELPLKHELARWAHVPPLRLTSVASPHTLTQFLVLVRRRALRGSFGA